MGPPLKAAGGDPSWTADGVRRTEEVKVPQASGFSHHDNAADFPKAGKGLEGPGSASLCCLVSEVTRIPPAPPTPVKAAVVLQFCACPPRSSRSSQKKCRN